MDIRKGLLRPTWIEIDLDVMKSNIAEIKRTIGSSVKLIVVLKGNAYGCGLTETVEALSTEGIYGFGAGNIYEAIEVRKHTDLQILLFGNTLTNAIPEILRHEIVPSVSDISWVHAYSEAIPSGTAPLYVKVDVGLNRLGVPYNEALGFFAEISKLRNVRIAGIQTHITGSKEYVQKGLDEFFNVIKTLEDRGFQIPIKLAAHSQLVAQHPSSYLNAVDPGKLVYGIMPFKPEIEICIKPAFSKLTSRIIHVKKSIDFSPEKYEKIGIVPLGMADGLPSTYSMHGGEVLVKGKRAPIIKVHAEHTRVNLSQISESAIGDEVVFIGNQEGASIDFYEVAKKCGTTESEVLRSLSHCLPRIYIQNGSPCKIVPFL